MHKLYYFAFPGILFGLLNIVVISPVFAAPDIAWNISAPQIRAGEVATFVVYFNQPVDAKDTATLPQEITMTATVFTQTERLVAKAVDQFPSLSLRPGNFLRRTYALNWPNTLHGNVELRLVDFTAPVLLVAATTEISTLATQELPESKTPASRIVTNEPIYFIAGGGDHESAKFQLSFKYRLFDLENDTHALHRINFGYTQTTLWDLGEKSAPFRDTSYRPSIFYERMPLRDPKANFAWGLQTGLEHESNGKSGSDSRSVNTAFIKPIFTIGNPAEYYWTIAPKIYDYLQKSDNPDIANYRGYADLQIKYGKDDRWQLSALARKGQSSGKGSLQLDLSYPLDHVVEGTTGSFFLLQYFNGWGEDILDYNNRIGAQIRAGFMIVR